MTLAVFVRSKVDESIVTTAMRSRCVGEVREKIVPLPWTKLDAGKWLAAEFAKDNAFLFRQQMEAHGFEVEEMKT